MLVSHTLDPIARSRIALIRGKGFPKSRISLFVDVSRSHLTIVQKACTGCLSLDHAMAFGIGGWTRAGALERITIRGVLPVLLLICCCLVWLADVKSD